jgi:hypothetical protein
MRGGMTDVARSRSIPARALFALGVAALALLAAGKPAPVPPQLFDSPEAAADALAQAARSGEEKAVLAVLGSAGEDIASSGDPVADRNGRAKFAEDYAEGHRIERKGDAKATLVYGDDDYPFPVPIVEQDGRWRFDAAAGREEILARRVGRNELDAIQVCLAYVDAQREYGSVDRNHDGLFDYAEKILSSPGQHDGLYWPTQPGEPRSPRGELVAEAQAQGYRYENKRAPYHGYFYKVLTAQGPHARGGAYDYIVHGRMIGGFALLAWPAEYGVSGIMTFEVNHDGVVFSKDLGPKTGELAAKITRFDPDSGWKREE